jgi:hypothetical protein
MDETWFIIGEEIYAELPAFKKSPVYSTLGIDGVLIVKDIELKSTGSVHMCVLEKSGDDQFVSSYQVVNKLNESNYPCQYTASATNPDGNATLSVSGLAVDKEYVAFVSATNSIQTYPDMLED